jgi:UTP--glucose-1-phosphate uridylyltransferase
MLPIIDKPLIQYAVDEAVEAGCDTLVFVTNRYKHAVADYFDKAYELEQKLERAGKSEQLDLIRNVLPSHVRAVFVTQAEALGLGHAVLCAKSIVGNQPFCRAVAGRPHLESRAGALKQMADVAEASGASVIAVQDVPREQTGSYGIVATQSFQNRQGRITAIVEKPAPEVAPSTLAVVGRYVLSPRIFDLLESTQPGAGGEIQLTDAIATLLSQEPWMPIDSRARVSTVATHIGLIEATIRYALDHEKLSDSARKLMQNALDETRCRRPGIGRSFPGSGLVSVRCPVAASGAEAQPGPDGPANQQSRRRPAPTRLRVRRVAPRRARRHRAAPVRHAMSSIGRAETALQPRGMAHVPATSVRGPIAGIAKATPSPQSSRRTQNRTVSGALAPSCEVRWFNHACNCHSSTPHMMVVPASSHSARLR